MFQQTGLLLKKGYTYYPGRAGRGGKNLVWMPKLGFSRARLQRFWSYMPEYPRRRPNHWGVREAVRLELPVVPKEVGFFNEGDNWELTPEMEWRMFLKNKDAEFWRVNDNEKAVIAQFPLIAKDPAAYFPRATAILEAHVARFGADHVIYNAVMQAAAFTRDFKLAEKYYKEMQDTGMVLNAQSIVNMMLAVRLAGLPKKKANDYFLHGIKIGALQAVLRLDTEFQMWWDQLQRMGSFVENKHEEDAKDLPQFVENGFLSVNEENATDIPKNIWKLWGWDNTERKFEERRARIEKEAGARSFWQETSYKPGSVEATAKRQPWYKYKGYSIADFHGPRTFHKDVTAFERARTGVDGPPPSISAEKASKAW